MLKQSPSSNFFHKDFTLFLLITSQAYFGASISGIALSFLVLEITGSASAMAIALALKILPTVFVPAIATFVDRIPLKIPLILNFFLRGITLLGLCIGAKFEVFSINVIYMIALFNGIVGTIFIPASQVLLPNLLKTEHLVRGNSLISTISQGMGFCGLLVGGILVSLIGPSLTIAIEGACFGIAGCLLFFVRFPEKEISKTSNPFVKDLFVSLSMLKTSQIVAMIAVMAFFRNIIIAVLQVLMPVHMENLGKGAAGYGTYLALIMVGILFGNSIITLLGRNFNMVLGVAVGWLVIGVSSMGLGIWALFYFTLLWAIVYGVGIAFLNTSISIIIQQMIPENIRGRVSGMVMSFMQIGMPIALFILSYIIRWVTLFQVFFTGAIMASVFAIIWFKFIYSQKNYKMLENV